MWQCVVGLVCVWLWQWCGSVEWLWYEAESVSEGFSEFAVMQCCGVAVVWLWDK